jgi:1,5-anhydro-D-fructose reductase (1,5-anhydro-D-mannitol-forming)
MTVRWGILGCGAVCEKKSGPGFQLAHGSQLVAVMRRDPERARDFAQRHGVPKWTTEARALLEDPDVNAVYVASPPGTHLQHALLACAARKPTYVEKPMARNHAECMVMVEQFRQAGVPLFVAYYRRRLPRFLKARELIREGRLGTITSLAYRYAAPKHLGVDKNAPPWRLRAEQSGGGLFLDLGSHTLDLIDYLLGPLTDVRGLAGNLSRAAEVEDVVATVFRVPCGALGTAEWNFGATPSEDRIEICGTEGTMVLSTFGHEAIELKTGSGVERFPFSVPEHIQQPLIQSIVDQLEGRGPCPSTGESGARTTRVMDEILEDYYGPRGPDFWDNPDSWPGRAR